MLAISFPFSGGGKMSFLKAEQVRRELFMKYSEQIAEILGESESENQRHGENILSQRFRISYPRQRLLRQRALQVSPEAKAEYLEATAALPVNSVCVGEQEEAVGDAEVNENVETIHVELEEKERWPVYNEPYPSVYRMMHRIQNDSLRLLQRESRDTVVPHRGDEYSAQRMEVLEKIEKNIGQERAKILARMQKMDGKLHASE